MAPTPKTWLEHNLIVDSTSDFILAGGSLIRFVVVQDDVTHYDLREQLRAELKKINFSIFNVPSHKVELQHPHKVVTDIAKRLPLEEYIKAFIARIWQECGCENGELRSAREMSNLYGRNVIDLEEKFMRVLREQVGLSFHSVSQLQNSPYSRQLSRDFANGLRAIGSEYMEQGYSPSIGLFINWLRGDSTASTRKMLRIQWPIRKENATSTLRSLMTLPLMANREGADRSLLNRAGTLLHLDIRWLTDPKSVDTMPSLRTPTRTARTAVYQWLRELIDQTSEFRSSFIVVEVGPSFVSQDPKGIGVGTYDALKNRILDDVILSGDPNLSAVLVPLHQRPQ